MIKTLVFESWDSSVFLSAKSCQAFFIFLGQVVTFFQKRIVRSKYNNYWNVHGQALYVPLLRD